MFLQEFIFSQELSDIDTLDFSLAILTNLSMVSDLPSITMDMLNKILVL